jgi:hypothetical protein
MVVKARGRARDPASLFGVLASALSSRYLAQMTLGSVVEEWPPLGNADIELWQPCFEGS